MHIHKFFPYLFLPFLAACGSDKGDSTDKELAAVYNKTLRLSEIATDLPKGIPAQDSALLVSAATQRWIEEQLLMYEAERNIPKDLNIDELVRNYRASLVRFNFEESLVSEKMDSIVQEQELRDYYEQNKDQFQLESTIAKCILLKVPQKAPQNDLSKIWNSRNEADRAKVENWAKQWAVMAMLDREKWYNIEDLAAILPSGTLNADNVGSRREGTVSDGDFRYFYKILDTAHGKTTAPYDYAKGQAKKIILQKRKMDLLKKWKEDLYQKEIKRENVKIY
jgi:hypothetical protein